MKLWHNLLCALTQRICHFYNAFTYHKTQTFDI